MSDIGNDTLYKEIGLNIRDTDAISFKLLNLVPLGSTLGSGILALFQKNSLLGSTPGPVMASVIVFLSVAGGTIVFGLYKWEQRNIQKCKWFIARAADLEKEGLQFKGWLDQQATWSKSRAERIIYRTSMLIWLIPVAMLAGTYLRALFL